MYLCTCIYIYIHIKPSAAFPSRDRFCLLQPPQDFENHTSATPPGS